MRSSYKDTISVDETSPEFKAHVQNRVSKALDRKNRIPHKEAMKQIRGMFRQSMKAKYGEDFEVYS